MRLIGRKRWSSAAAVAGSVWQPQKKQDRKKKFIHVQKNRRKRRRGRFSAIWTPTTGMRKAFVRSRWTRWCCWQRRTTAVSITSQVFPTSRENMENNARNRTASEKIRLQAAWKRKEAVARIANFGIPSSNWKDPSIISSDSSGIRSPFHSGYFHRIPDASLRNFWRCTDVYSL